MCTDCKRDQGWKKCSRNWHGDYPTAHGENHNGKDHYTVAHWGMLRWEQVEMPGRKPHRQIPVPCERTNTKLVCSWRTVPHKGDPHWNSSLRTAVHWKQIIWAAPAVSFHERNPTLQKGNSAERKEQWQVQQTDWEPSIPYHPCTIHSREIAE